MTQSLHADARPTGASVSVDDITKSYRTPAGRAVKALAGLTLTIQPGEFIAVMAPSGAGKSTLLHVVGALDVPDSGSVRVDGVELNKLSRREQDDYRRGVGFVFQRFHLLPTLDAQHNVAAPVVPYRTNFDKRQRSAELLSAVGLGDRLDALPGELSGGQQQRVAVARALINSPRLLLADEPTGNLDSVTGQELLDLLLQIHADRRMTTVIATHDHNVAERCSRIIQIEDGQVLTEVAII